MIRSMDGKTSEQAFNCLVEHIKRTTKTNMTFFWARRCFLGVASMWMSDLAPPRFGDFHTER